MKAICVTGTPATGKTTLAKELACALDFEYVDVNEVINNNPSVVVGIDDKLDTKEVDEDKLIPVLEEMIKKSKKRLVIDSHLSHWLPKKAVKICIVVKCDLKVIQDRLKERGYSAAKIKENVNSEIFDVCLIEAVENGHKTLLVDTTEGYDINSVIGGLE